jgi:hypothetical protein
MIWVLAAGTAAPGPETRSARLDLSEAHRSVPVGAATWSDGDYVDHAFGVLRAKITRHSPARSRHSPLRAPEEVAVHKTCSG